MTGKLNPILGVSLSNAQDAPPALRGVVLLAATDTVIPGNVLFVVLDAGKDLVSGSEYTQVPLSSVLEWKQLFQRSIPLKELISRLSGDFSDTPLADQIDKPA